MLSARTAAKVLSGQQNRSILITGKVKREVWIERPHAVVRAGGALIEVAEIVKKIGAKPRSFDRLQKLLGYH
jgi:hypothetical protein